MSNLEREQRSLTFDFDREETEEKEEQEQKEEEPQEEDECNKRTNIIKQDEIKQKYEKEIIKRCKEYSQESSKKSRKTCELGIPKSTLPGKYQGRRIDVNIKNPLKSFFKTHIYSNHFYQNNFVMYPESIAADEGGLTKEWWSKIGRALIEDEIFTKNDKKEDNFFIINNKFDKFDDYGIDYEKFNLTLIHEDEVNILRRGSDAIPPPPQNFNFNANFNLPLPEEGDEVDINFMRNYITNFL